MKNLREIYLPLCNYWVLIDNSYRQGKWIALLVKGRSMLPFILGGRESVVLTRPLDIPGHTKGGPDLYHRFR